MKYTKGEWWLELRPDDNVRRVRTNSEAIADVFGTNAEDKANAQLIASAPAYHEGVAELLRDWDAFGKVGQATIIKLRKAQAKAESK